jgi:hypothetical protein
MKGEARGGGARRANGGQPLQGSHCDACARVRVEDTGWAQEVGRGVSMQLIAIGDTPG